MLDRYGVYIAGVGSVNRFVIFQHFGLISLLAFLFPILFKVKKRSVQLMLLIHGTTCLLFREIAFH